MGNSNFVTEEMFSELNNKHINYNKYLSMIHCNIRSLRKYCDNIEIHLNTLRAELDVIAITESWLNAQDNNDNYLDVYRHICKYRQHKKGGGVSIFINKHITSRNK